MPSRVRASLACKRLHKFSAGNGGDENSPGDGSWGSEKERRNAGVFTTSVTGG